MRWFLAYDPSVSPEDNASKEILSEKYSKLLSYMDAVGFTNEVCTQGEDFPCDKGQECLSLTQGYKSLASISLRMFRTKCHIQEITNILKCLASVLHIGNISFGAINQQSNSAFVRDPQPVQCASALPGVSG